MTRYQVIRQYSFEFESDEKYDPESEEGAVPLAQRYLEAHPEPEIVAEILARSKVKASIVSAR